MPYANKAGDPAMTRPWLNNWDAVANKQHTLFAQAEQFEVHVMARPSSIGMSSIGSRRCRIQTFVYYLTKLFCFQETPTSERSDDDSSKSDSFNSSTTSSTDKHQHHQLLDRTLDSDDEAEDMDSAEEEEIDVGEDAGSTGSDDCNMAANWVPPANTYIPKLDGD